ncbi:hypothetical protein KC356_g261 [Hortaea werneckii]|nr:hypothetical protein KC356_g261 [Hortaea werneckii]
MQSSWFSSVTSRHDSKHNVTSSIQTVAKEGGNAVLSHAQTAQRSSECVLVQLGMIEKKRMLSLAPVDKYVKKHDRQDLPENDFD